MSINDFTSDRGVVAQVPEHHVLCCFRDSLLTTTVMTGAARACLSPRASTTRRQDPVLKWRLTFLGRSLRCFTMYTACKHLGTLSARFLSTHSQCDTVLAGGGEITKPCLGTSTAGLRTSVAL